MAAPRTATEVASAQARDAWDRGRAAMDSGAWEEARRWFGRACRLAPADITPLLSLAGACLAAGLPRRAADLFDGLVRQADGPTAWLGLVSARAHDGDWTGAAAALKQALSHYANRRVAVETLADAVAREAGYAGWCGLDGAGRLLVGASGPAVARVDGRAVPDTVTGFEPPASCRLVTVTVGKRPLLGSPIRLAAIRRLEGVVEADGEGGLSGWVWHPGDPDRDPRLTLVAGLVRRTILATDHSVAASRPLAQPRGFRISAAELRGLDGTISVRGPDGTELAGSPVSARPLACGIAVNALLARPAEAALCPERPVAIVVPVYRGARETLACLRDVFASVPEGTTVIVVDDASPEPALVRSVTALAAAGRITLLRRSHNLGFPGAANTGLRAAMRLDPPCDVVLLNSDTRMAPASGWLERLRAAIHGSADIGTASPLSNDASIASYPDAAGGNTPPSGRDLARLSRLAARANPQAIVDAPTGIGFCLYLRHECLTQTGLLREDVFAQGYGEENDFCRRATRLGWRHVIVPGAYVAHVGGRSFGAAREALLARNLRVLENLHPGYGACVADWIARDPLAPARRRLDLLRAAGRGGGSVLLVTHDQGGGVERCVRDRLASLRAEGRQAILLRPAMSLPGLIRLEDGSDAAAFPNLVFRLSEERAELLAALRARRPVAMEVHHLLGHDHSVLGLAPDLGIAYDMRLHDYAVFCPRITLTAASGRYCGEPDIAGCTTCVATHGSLLEEPIGPAALRTRSAIDLAGAARVLAPSADMATRLRRHFPSVRVQVAPHETDPAGPLAAMSSGEHRRVLLVGAIGRAKGYDILLACARDAAELALPLRFVVVGRTIDDDALLDTGCAEITGPYREGEAATLIAEQAAQVGFVPSLWPETWCFALGEVLRAGLAAVAFDIGAQAERIRGSGRGWLLPLGTSPSIINRFLQHLPSLSLALHANVMQTGSDREMTQTHQCPRPGHERPPLPRARPEQRGRPFGAAGQRASDAARSRPVLRGADPDPGG